MPANNTPNLSREEATAYNKTYKKIQALKETFIRAYAMALLEFCRNDQGYVWAGFAAGRRVLPDVVEQFQPLWLEDEVFNMNDSKDWRVIRIAGIESEFWTAEEMLEEAKYEIRKWQRFFKTAQYIKESRLEREQINRNH